ncbi:neuroligin-2 isoform X1 [Nilaparvata lugens]|uniref:neuroligin-2 isoform X1 n=1 Tax=Nilaparvata lugens TaxID=108931 RepID=UPI00193E328C|nr:neuroligin-2 isoform X1 [Nilaparvata lugens]
MNSNTCIPISRFPTKIKCSFLLFCILSLSIDAQFTNDEDRVIRNNPFGPPPSQPPNYNVPIRQDGFYDPQNPTYNSNNYGVPGDPRFRGSFTNNGNFRNYGQPGLGASGAYIPQNYDPTKLNQLNPGQNIPLPGLENQQFRLPDGVRLPGVLGGWRPDLQGKQRPDSLLLDKDVYVKTPVGQVQGFKVYLYDDPNPRSSYRPGRTPVDRIMGNVSVFLGIPYALPPLPKIARFKPPRPHPGWQQLQAVDFGPACPQPNDYTGATKGIRDVHEDCLYLNIYSPNTKGGLAQLYPVMFYIHGGDFYHGASNLFPGHVLAAFYDVVVVTINYRLGVFGFLSTGDVNSPGNYGILDQAMALRWVYENIGSFNGDRESITLFGPGAGAASAGLLMVNPRTRSYVKRVIAQSGSALADWAMTMDKYRAQNTSREFAQHVGCSIDNTYKMVDCLAGRGQYELANAQFTEKLGLIPWGPVYDHNFTVPRDGWFEGWNAKDWRFAIAPPEEQIRRAEFNGGLSYMTGVTTQEAAPYVYNNASLGPYYELDEKFLDEQLQALILRYNYTLNRDGVFRAIKYMYTYWPDPYNKTQIRQQFIDLLSDFLYRAPTDKIVKLLVEQGVPVYMYVMNTTVESLHLPEWRKYPHNIEHLFLTGAPFMDVEFFPSKLALQRTMWTENDRNISHFFMKAYSNFARFGNPTHTEILGLHFDVARNGILKYLNLNTTFNSTIEMNYRQKECAFWTMYLPSVIGILIPTYPPTTEFWWEPREPLQIAFWSMSGMCMFLIVVVVICCILWRNAERKSDYYSSDVLMMRDEPEHMDGIENRTQHNSRSIGNIYEYRDAPAMKTPQLSSEPRRAISSQSLRSNSATSLKDVVSNSPMGEPRRLRTPPPASKRPQRTAPPQQKSDVPQTEV